VSFVSFAGVASLVSFVVFAGLASFVALAIAGLAALCNTTTGFAFPARLRTDRLTAGAFTFAPGFISITRFACLPFAEGVVRTRVRARAFVLGDFFAVFARDLVVRELTEFLL
jgi:hypothetical protein